MTGRIEADDWPAREQGFRRILRLFPAKYRDERGEEILEVLQDNASATSPRSEKRALLALGMRVWSRRALSIDPAVSSRAAAIASVLVPALSLLVAGHALTVWLLNGPDLRFSALGPAWAVWAIGVVLLVAAGSRWARWIMAGAVPAFVVGIVFQVNDFNFQLAVQEASWVPCMAMATALAWNPDRTTRGRKLLGLPALWSTGTIASALGVGYVLLQRWWWSFGFSVWPEAVRTVVFVALPLTACACLMFRLTRALLPLVAVFVGLVYGAVNAAEGFGNFTEYPLPANLTPWPQPDWTALSPIMLYPIVAFVLTRAVTAVIDQLALRKPGTPEAA